VGGAKAWLHVQDFEVDAAFDLGLLKGQRIRKLVAGAERWLMRRFDVVSTISQRMHQRLLAKGVAAYRRELFIPDGAVVALYSGNMGGKQGLEVLADLAKQNNWGQIPINFVPNTAQGTVEPAQAATNVVAVVFVFCGNGAGRADLVQRCQGLPNVRFIDLQPAERLPDLLATADIHLLPQRADAADLVMPSKLTGMLTSARPVVATAHPGTELASVVQTCGLVVLPEDPAAMAQAVRTLALDAAQRQRLGAAGYAYALAQLDREAVLQKFEAELLELLSNG
jgi:colanic acid biosynthesis glycosyl transferase WcaI